jgi:uncharacterized protein YndB with AHSA1/START domain
MSLTAEPLLNDALGAIRRDGETYEIAYVRHFARPVEKLWAALTVPARIAAWLCAAEVDLRLGGRIALHWTDCEPHYRMEGEIVELAPPRVIAWTWPDPKHPDSVVRWALEPEGDGCRLTLTQSGLKPPHLTDTAAGWHTYLECLQAGADGTATPWNPGREAEIAKLYRALTLP